MIKSLWALGVALSFACSVYLILSSVLVWLRQPFVTYIESVPIREFHFPAVTICPDSWQS